MKEEINVTIQECHSKLIRLQRGATLFCVSTHIKARVCSCYTNTRLGDCRAGKDTSFNGIKAFFNEKKWIFHSFMKLTLPKLIHYSLKMCFFVPISNKYLIVSQRIDIPSWNDSYIWRNNLNQSFDWPWKHNNY